MLSDFHFLRPLWLLALLPLAWVLWQLRLGSGGADAWRKVVDAHLLPRMLSDLGGDARRLPLLLLAIGWVLAVLALAGPTWQRLPEPLFAARQYRVIVLDLSASMNATDLAPSRLARARYKVLDLLRAARDGQTALLAYGAEPFVVAPLTGDAETIAAQVPHLETSLLPVGGARREDLALAQAGDLLRQAEAPDGQVLLLTGSLDSPGAAIDAARRLRGDGYRVSVLGIGTTKGGPVAGPDGALLKDDKGAIRMARLDDDALRELAGAGGGRYIGITADDGDILALAPDAPVLPGEAGDARQSADRWREEGPWLLLLLLPLAALGFRRGWFGALSLTLLLLPPPDASAATWDGLWQRPDQRAAALLEDGKPEQAAGRFERPDWRAAAHYRAGDYAAALSALEGLDGPEVAYNRGNALARLDRLDEALAAYDTALTARPDDADARHNRDLVQRLLDQRRAQRERDSAQNPRSADAGQPGETTGEDDATQGDTAGAEQGSQQADASSQQDQTNPAGQRDQSAAAGDQADDRQAGDAGADTGGQAGATQDDGQGPETASADGDTSDDGQRNGPQRAQSAQQDQQTDARQHSTASAADAARQDVGGEGEVEPRSDRQAEASTAGERQTPDPKTPGASGDQHAATPDEEPSDPATETAEPGAGRDDPSERTGDLAQQNGAGGGERDEPPQRDDQGEAPNPAATPQGANTAATGGPRTPQAPGLSDLLRDRQQLAAQGMPGAEVPHVDPEDRQAIEQMLRRVDDDPAGLLRQRFLLQHLRRSGRLP